MDDITLFHSSDIGKSYKISTKCLKMSEFLNNKKNKQILNYMGYIVKSGDIKAFEFVIEYINYYKDATEEIPPPEVPLSEDTNLHDMFEYEPVFIKYGLTKKDNICENNKLINNILRIAEELKMVVLILKLSAILAVHTFIKKS